MNKAEYNQMRREFNAENFKPNLKRAHKCEALVLEALKERKFSHRRVSPEEELSQGIDAILGLGVGVYLDRNIISGISVEIKSDFKCHKTSNFFVEILKEFPGPPPTFRPGWALTSRAQIFAFHEPLAGVVYLIDGGYLKRMLGALFKANPMGKCLDEGKTVHGILLNRRVLVGMAWGELKVPRVDIRGDIIGTQAQEEKSRGNTN